jgi:CheY-like chemotaxis protein
MRVLVVEDEQDTAEALSWGLTAEGYVVDMADNGVDGLWKAVPAPRQPAGSALPRARRSTRLTNDAAGPA